MDSLRIESDGDALIVRVEGAPREAQAFYDTVCECRRRSQWSCPSGECAQIDTCETVRDGDTVVLRLTPRPGESLSAAGVGECLRYVIGTPGEGSDDQAGSSGR